MRKSLQASIKNDFRNSILTKEIFWLGISAINFSLLCLFLLNTLHYYPFFSNKPYLFELLKTDFDLPVGLIFFCSIANIYLLYFLTKKIFSSTTAIFAAVLYGISPWSVYMGTFNSLFSMGVFFGLVFGIGLILTQKNNLGIWLIFLGMIGLLGCSLIFWIIPTFFLLVNLKYRFLDKKCIKIVILVFLISGIALLLLAFHDLNYFKQVAKHEVTIFQDVGLINTINNFQGESQKAHLGFLGRAVNNKYSNFGLKILNNFFVHFFPLTFFTPEFKMFNFSAEPPILFGFFIPFFWGLKEIIQQKKIGIFLGFFLILIMPSVLASNPPDLNRLFMVSPLIFIIIAVGLKPLKNQSPNLFWLSIILITLQMSVILTDIYLREPQRLLPTIINVYGKLY